MERSLRRLLNSRDEIRPRSGEGANNFVFQREPGALIWSLLRKYRPQEHGQWGHVRSPLYNIVLSSILPVGTSLKIDNQIQICFKPPCRSQISMHRKRKYHNIRRRPGSILRRSTALLICCVLCRLHNNNAIDRTNDLR